MIKLTLILDCDCGNNVEIALLHYKDAADDYVMLGDSINNKFKAHQSHPDVTTITCQQCFKDQNVSI